jgi:hypothetical protein
MRTDLKLAGKVLALPTLALGLVAWLVPGRIELAARIYALVLAATTLALVLAALRRSFPPAAPIRPAPLRDRSGRAASPPTLVRLEQACALGAARSFDLHHRLRPRLREIAAPLLSIRRGIPIDESPDAARLVLGEETWELVRPDRPLPADRRAPGIPLATLRTVVESLERL